MIVKSNKKSTQIFISTWLKHNRNATKAYLELHPNVEYSSARVLGSRELTKVNIEDVLAGYGMDIDTYMKGLHDGLHATKSYFLGNIAVQNPDWKVRSIYLDLLGKLLGI